MVPKVAYISSEFALSDDLPTYAGGLGILAGDMLYQAAESQFPLCGISILYKEGFFQQKVDAEGKQQSFYEQIDPVRAGLENTGEMIEIPVVDHTVKLKIWRKDVIFHPNLKGLGFPPPTPVPLFLLDANIPENSPEDRKITDRLYERVWAPHISDDLVLGVGGVRTARQLNLPIEVWQINDDHGAFNIMERLRENLAQGMALAEAREKVKSETVFTTHTPATGAESKFSREELIPVLNNLFAGLKIDLEEIWRIGRRELNPEEVFSLTVFAMRHARTINAVSKKHLDGARNLWSFIGDLPLTSVTNAVYAPRWTAGELLNLRGWGSETSEVELWEAKTNAKRRAAEQLSHLAFEKRRFDPKALVLVWARRFTEYKQPTLLVSDLDRLAKILVNRDRPVYLLMSGKAHPEDPQGHGFVKQVVEASRDPRLEGHLIYFPNYGLSLAKDLLAAADVWLNTPVVGWEASGTSGMKAVFNGALNASSLDGWWAEGFQPEAGEQVANGWAIEPPTAENVYQLLEDKIVPAFYDQKEKWVTMIQESLRSCGKQFHTVRLLEEYRKLYQL